MIEVFTAVCFESVWRFHQRKSRCIQQKWVELLAIVDLFDGGKWVSRQLSLGFDHQTNSMPQISKHQWQKQHGNWSRKTVFFNTSHFFEGLKNANILKHCQIRYGNIWHISGSEKKKKHLLLSSPHLPYIPTLRNRDPGRNAYLRSAVSVAWLEAQALLRFF